MTIYKEFSFGSKNGKPFGSFGAVISLILIFVLIYFVAKGLFTLLSFVAPFLILLTLILDYKVVIDYSKFLFKLLSDNLLIGIIGIILTFIGFPVIAGYLFLKAVARRSIKSRVNKSSHYNEYEEIEEDTSFLELPSSEEIDIEDSNVEHNNYNDLFK